MVIRVPVNLDVTDNDIAESIEDEVDRGARGPRTARAGNIIGRALGAGIGTGISSSIQSGVARGTSGLNLSGVLRGASAQFGQQGDEAGRSFGDGISRGVRAAEPGISTFGQLELSDARVGAAVSGVLGLVVPVGPALGGVAAAAAAVAGAVGQAAGAAISAGGVFASLGLRAGAAQGAARGLS